MNIPVNQVKLAHITRGAKGIDAVGLYVLNHILDPLTTNPKLQGMVLTSAYRSVAQQALLYAAYRAGRGPRAAPPGRSWHHFTVLHDGSHRWAIDIKIPGRMPATWVYQLTDTLEKRKTKWHTAATEKTWVHLQGHFGGGEIGNPGRIEQW